MKIKDIIRLRHLSEALHKHRHKPMWQKIIIIGLWVGLTVFGFFSLILIVFAGIISLTLPNAYELTNYIAHQSSQILDRDGNVLYNIHGEERRTIIPFTDISKNLINATISIEDSEFYYHHGIDIPGIIKAIISEITFQNNRGGSTLTQQYVKNTFFNSERKYTRKMAEIIMAIKVENVFSKDKILELYFNRIPYGNNAYGIEEASLTFFAKHAKDINMAESVILASIPKGPTYYSPYGNHSYTKLTRQFTEQEILRRNIKTEQDLDISEIQMGLLGSMANLDAEGKYKIYLAGRTDLVLQRMEYLKYINSQQRKETVEQLTNFKFNDFKEDINAPHFVLWIKDQVEKKYGKDLLEQGGLKIHTTLDSKMQKFAEDAIKKRADFNLRNYNGSDAALISINPKTGEILAMVGSADYNNDKIKGKVNMIINNIQPGSSFKPFVYANGFLNHGLSPATVLYDVGTDFGDVSFKNYDGSFMGPITIRKALGQSRNIPALKAYFLSGQEQEIIPFAKKLGIQFQNENNDYGSSLALGAADVNFLSFVEAYSVFANQGNHVEPVAISKILNGDGEILEEWIAPKKDNVLDPQAAYLITNILSDTSVRLGGKLTLDGRPNAAKTGTSSVRKGENRLPKDAIAVGYTPSLLTAVWIGNADGTPMIGSADGYNSSAPIWKEFMDNALKGSPVEQFVRPNGISTVTVSSATGLLPSENTPSDMLRSDIFASFNLPSEHESPETFKKIKYDTLTKHIANAFCPPELIKEKVIWQHHNIFTQFPKWEAGVQAWGVSSNTSDPDGIIMEECPLHTSISAKFAPTVSIIEPSAYSYVETAKTLEIKIITNSRFEIDKADFYINDNLRFTSNTAPYDAKIFIPTIFSAGSELELKVIVKDKLGYQAQAKLKLKIAGTPQKNNESNNQSTSTDTQTPSSNTDTTDSNTIKLGNTIDITQNNTEPNNQN